MQKLDASIKVERYTDGSLGIIFSKEFREKFDEIFGNRPVNVFVAVGENDGRMIIQIELPKYEAYIH